MLVKCLSVEFGNDGELVLRAEYYDEEYNISIDRFFRANGISNLKILNRTMPERVYLEKITNFKSGLKLFALSDKDKLAWLERIRAYSGGRKR